MNFLRKHWRLLIIVIFILLVGGVIVNRVRGQNVTQQAAQEKVVKIKKGTLAEKTSASGKVKSEKQVDLKFQTSGYLAWVGVKEGDTVKQYQTIASLDQRELEKRLQKALRDYSKERWDFEEDRRVTYKDKVITDTIQRILEKNGFDLDKAVLDVEIADLAKQFSYLWTPIAGIVTRVDTSVAGVNITPASAVFTIADPESMIFQANIEEGDIAHIVLGQKAKINLDAHPDETFEGEVSKVAFSSVSTSGGGTAFPVEIKLPKNDSAKFKIGMNGDMEITYKEIKDVLLVPDEAVFKENDQTYVWQKTPEGKQKIAVKTGRQNDGEIEVTEGVKEGEEIVIIKKK